MKSKDQFEGGSGGSLHKGLAYQEAGGMKPEDTGSTNKGPNQAPHGPKKHKDGKFKFR